ncbi:acetyl-CoA acetyltransferase [Microcella sp.]|uniref:acetyl-CoA acetyltransferase n=1 Tax=Microcella sp. TaxID=1913979 RepID=UPI0025667D2C|nr:acetyl-CoA acetyltransferase [Microcella sp.]MBX9472370.1 thiolase domain-containing protein [Microcella sp.]
MRGALQREVAIAGIGLSDYPVAPGMTSEQHAALAFRRALDDSGLTKADVDGFFSAGDALPHFEDAENLAEYLGIQPRYFDSTFTGGSAFEVLLQHAALAIAAGECEVALIVYGSDARSRHKRGLGAKGLAPTTYLFDQPQSGPRRQGNAAAFEAPWGSSIISSYALAAQRHMYEYGTTSAQLAEIAVAMRYNAQFNPNAMYRDPLSVEEVLASPMLADPLHRWDCCVVSDGGGAVIMTSGERARDLKTTPVYVLAAKNAATHYNIAQMPDYTQTAAAMVADDVFRAADVTRDDIDTLQIYDSFTITVLLQLEDLGFAPKGEGGAWVSDGKLKVGGALPTNTDGGGLSACHPGMRGIFLIIEATRQLRHDAGDAQTPNAQLALVSGSGGILSHIGVAILGRQP